jgi:hypothetical protein
MGISQTPQALVPAEFVSGGMTLLSTTTLSGTEVVLSSIPSSYKNLQLVTENYLPATDSASIRMRFNGDTNTRYQREIYVFGDNNTFNASFIQVSQVNDNAVSSGLIVTDIYSYAASTWKMVETRGITVNPTTTTNSNWTWYLGFYNQTTAITSITLYPSSGNFTSGTVKLYGVN